MNIIEAIKAVMAKKKVRRKSKFKSSKEYFNKSGYIYMCDKAYRPDYSSPVNQFDIDDILAEDWEIVEDLTTGI